jgi:integrase
MTVFKRAARPSLYFTGKTRFGWQQLCTHTPDKRLAAKMEAMWVELAEEQRAWDVLERVLAKQLPISDLYDLWRESVRDVHELRRRLDDSNVEPMVAEFLDVHGLRVRPDTLEHVKFHLRWLLPDGVPRVASMCTADWLTQRLAAYKGKRNTIRKVHASWSSFFGYCTKPKKIFRTNPMEDVERPPLEKSTIRYYEMDVIERIVDWQPTPARRAFFALLYGGAPDVSTALGIMRADLLPANRECRAPGTKASARDRVLRVDDWAWERLWGYAKDLLPAARLFPTDWSRHMAHDWHSAAIKDLKISPKYPPRFSRHAWAVRHLRAGVPLKIVQVQLGHATPQMTLNIYGTFIPDGADRDHWQQQTAAFEQRRREAQ